MYQGPGSKPDCSDAELITLGLCCVVSVAKARITVIDPTRVRATSTVKDEHVTTEILRNKVVKLAELRNKVVKLAELRDVTLLSAHNVGNVTCTRLRTHGMSYGPHARL